jgi:hypothetical protein
MEAADGKFAIFCFKDRLITFKADVKNGYLTRLERQNSMVFGQRR